jgi:short-subunit dehydrogenase
LPFPNKAAYCVSKAPAAMAFACLRTELRSQGIRVTDFVPPVVATGLVRSAIATRPDLLAREVDIVRAHAWPAEAVGGRIARAVRDPRTITICGLMTRAAVVAARCFPVLSDALAARAAKPMKPT